MSASILVLVKVLIHVSQQSVNKIPENNTSLGYYLEKQNTQYYHQINVGTKVT